MSVIPVNLVAVRHDFKVFKGDKKELIYTFPYAINTLTFVITGKLKTDKTTELPIAFYVDGNCKLYVVFDCTEIDEGTYIWRAQHTADSLPVTCIYGEIVIEEGV